MEVLGSMRKRLILAGLALLAAVSAYAVRTAYQDHDGPAATTITVPAEKAVGDGSAAPENAPPRPASPHSRLHVPPGNFASASAEPLPEGLGPESLRTAASKGDARAQFVIAGRYLNGQVVARDFVQAFKWYAKAAAQGLVPAQYRLAGLYEHGRGVEQDSHLALQWYRRAAASGNVKAMHNLAVLLAERAKQSGDYRPAAEWLRLAAEHGLPESQFLLGMLYHRGFGVEVNAAEAYYWLRLAALQGDQAAAAEMKTVEDSVPPNERHELERRLAAFQATERDRLANVVPFSDPAWQLTAAQSPALASVTELARVQSLLHRLGFDVGAADGRMSTKTANAIRLFQLQNGMAVDGEVGTELLLRLEQRQG